MRFSALRAIPLLLCLAGVWSAASAAVAMQQGGIDQVSTSGPGDTGKSITAPQINVERRSASQSPQLSSGRPSAAGAAALSTPSEGRVSATTQLQGYDRCDPQRLTSATPKERAECLQILERRSADFQRPAPRVLSPEERIATSRHLVPNTGDGRSAIRSLSSGNVEDSIAVQMLAPTPGASGGDNGAPKRTEEDRNADLQAIVEAVGVLTVQPPR